MRIEKISIENIKGIDRKEFNLNLTSNKVAILVAPNGFGKSSIAVAFEDMNGNRIHLNKNNYREENESLDYKVVVEYEHNGSTRTLEATNQSNQITNEFDIFVINNNLYAKTKQQSINGNTVATSSIAVANIELISTIPEKCSFSYSYRNSKTKYNCGNILPNIENYLKDSKLIEELATIDFRKFKGKKLSSTINAIGDLLSKYNGTIINQKQLIIDNTDFKNILTNTDFNTLFSAIKKYYQFIEVFEIVYIALQFIDLFNTDSTAFKKICKYSSYLNEKKEYDDLFSALETTWKNINPIEENRKLIIQFPKANLISNGQRDFLTFISSFISIRRKIKKQNCIIIIDEVFDYLDDANLIVAQYFISNFIQDYKSDKKNIFPIILTHLDPAYFHNYRFKKPQIKYLQELKRKENKNLEKIILNRDSEKNKSFNDKMDKFYFHFVPNSEITSIEFPEDFSTRNFHECYNTPEKFRNKILTVLKDYIDKKEYDIISVCCALRIIIEEYVYSLLQTEEQKGEFINTHKTDEKLNFASNNGIDFPEVLYLLGVIYNDSMHLNNVDKIIPIGYKLSNPFIYKMIKEVYELWSKQSSSTAIVTT